MSKMITPLTNNKECRLCQGDIIKDVDYFQPELVNNKVEITKSTFDNVIVLSQDCDLAQDNDNREKMFTDNNGNKDKFLLSVIVAPLYSYERFLIGEHLRCYDLQMQKIKDLGKTAVNNIIINSNPRYHYFDFGELNSQKMLESVVDFKHYLTINVEYLRYLKKTNFVGKIDELHRENLSQRFASFLSRIGLPDK